MQHYTDIYVSEQCYKALAQMARTQSNPHQQTVDELATKMLEQALENPEKLWQTLKKMLTQRCGGESAHEAKPRTL